MGCSQERERIELKSTAFLVALFVIVNLSGCATKPSNEQSAVRPPSTPSLLPQNKPSPQTAKEEVNPFKTELGRNLMLGFFVKPALKQMLHDPDSLQDLELISAAPIKKVPGSFKATVSYRARNALGALVLGQQAFTFTPNPNGSTGTDAWIVSLAKN